MTAGEHYSEAERLLVQASEAADSVAYWQVMAAQVHATLAMAATLELLAFPPRSIRVEETP